MKKIFYWLWTWPIKVWSYPLNIIMFIRTKMYYSENSFWFLQQICMLLLKLFLSHPVINVFRVHWRENHDWDNYMASINGWGNKGSYLPPSCTTKTCEIHISWFLISSYCAYVITDISHYQSFPLLFLRESTTPLGDKLLFGQVGEF